MLIIPYSRVDFTLTPLPPVQSTYQLSMDTFDTLFELMTSEALQGALDVSSSNASPVTTLLDVTVRAAESEDVRPAYLAGGCADVKLVRSPEALRLVVDLLGHCERKPDLQARIMEALVDVLDGSSTGIQVSDCLHFISATELLPMGRVEGLAVPCHATVIFVAVGDHVSTGRLRELSTELT